MLRRVRRPPLLALVLTLALGACKKGPPRPDAGCAIDAAGNLLDLVDGIVASMRARAGAGSEAVVVPTSADRDAFAARVVASLAGDETAACALPPSYRLIRYTDGRAGSLAVVAEVDAAAQPAPSLFWGTYAAPRAPTVATRATLAIEAPHPLFDIGTERESADLFVQGGARYLIIAGGHRCADAAQSGCSGTTTACGATQSYRISDAAHATALPFFAVHVALSSTTPPLSFLQLHGNSQSCPEALVSDTSGHWTDAGTAAALSAALASRGVTVGKCGAGYPTAGCTLCGTENVEARLTAGSADACTQPGSAYGRLVHVEQLPSLRAAPTATTAGYQPLIDAALATY
jgi:hypothetical protein